jgi:hypothetical protein
MGHTATGVGEGVGVGLGEGVGDGVGEGVGEAVGVGLGEVVGEGVGSGVPFRTATVAPMATTRRRSAPMTSTPARVRRRCIGRPC